MVPISFYYSRYFFPAIIAKKKLRGHAKTAAENGVWPLPIACSRRWVAGFNGSARCSFLLALMLLFMLALALLAAGLEGQVLADGCIAGVGLT